MAYNYDDTDHGTNGAILEDANGLWPHYGPNNDMVYAMWPPDNSPQTSSPWPLAIYVHAGGVNSHHLTSSTAGYLPLDNTASIFSTITTTRGMCLVSVEYSAGSFGTHILEYPNHALFPTQVLQIARAIQFFRDHHDDPAIWGSGNSIDPDKVVVMGSSQGGILSLLSGLPPEGWWGSDPLGFGDYSSRLSNEFQYRSNHRPNGIWADVPTVDFTQADLENGAFPGSGLPEAALWFTTLGDIQDVPIERLKAASPWWMLDSHDVDWVIPHIPMLCTWDDITDTFNWTGTWTPGVRNYRWSEAHADKPQAQLWHNLLQTKGFHAGGGTSEDVQTWWGGAGDGQANGAQDMSTSTKATVLSNWLSTHLSI